MQIKHVNQTNQFLTLKPLTEECFEDLVIAGSDETIWKHFPVNCTLRADMIANLQNLLRLQAQNEWHAHVIYAPNGECVGQTCYLNIRAKDAGVEIGGTWYNPRFQGTKINPAAKLLLLENAFELGAKRVDIKTDALNLHSRAAILKLGAKFEGILRKHMRRLDGSLRDTAYYSVIDDEWPQVREQIIGRLNK